MQPALKAPLYSPVPDFLELLCSPCCGRDLDKEADRLRCTQCQTDYPHLDGIPCLMRSPAAWCAEWMQAFTFSVLKLGHEVTSLREQVKNPNLLASTIDRMERLMDGKMRLAQWYERILQPLMTTYQTQYPNLTPPQLKTSTIAPEKYYENLLRDWVWATEENRLTLERAMNGLSQNLDVGACLVIGAGACRLASDFFSATCPSLMVVADINPVLFLAARRVLRGETLDWIEFPNFPRERLEVVVKAKNSSIVPHPSNFVQIFLDALEAPIRSETFDTLITPWFIDVASEDLRSLIPKLNRLLKPGGRWINLGPLLFSSPTPALHYSTEEVRELVEGAGFAISKWEYAPIPYLQSPYSSRARTESLLSFSAVKAGPAGSVKPSDLREPWIRKPSLPIPVLPQFEQLKVVSERQAYLLSLIDGKTSLTELVKRFSRKYQVPERAMVVGIEELLADLAQK